MTHSHDIRIFSEDDLRAIDAPELGMTPALDAVAALEAHIFHIKDTVAKMEDKYPFTEASTELAKITIFAAEMEAAALSIHALCLEDAAASAMAEVRDKRTASCLQSAGFAADQAAAYGEEGGRP